MYSNAISYKQGRSRISLFFLFTSVFGFVFFAGRDDVSARPGDNLNMRKNDSSRNRTSQKLRTGGGAERRPPGKTINLNANRSWEHGLPIHAGIRTALATDQHGARNPAAEKETVDKKPSTEPVSVMRNDNGENNGARELTLEQWLKLVRLHNPTLRVSRARLKSFDADIFSAKWSWLPVAEVNAAVAPTPRYRCTVPEEFLPSEWSEAEKQSWMNERVDGVPNRSRYCVSTDKDINVEDFRIQGVYTRFEARLGVPLSALWKRGFALTAARAQKNAGRYRADEIGLSMEKTAGKAYWGVKMAREMLFTLQEGRPILNKAIKRVEEELDSDEGDASMGDKFRLLILKSQLESWVLDAKQVESVALSGLRTLAGGTDRAEGRAEGKSEGGGSVDMTKYDVDKKPLSEAEEELGSLETHLDSARKHHPQLKMLGEYITGADALVNLRKSEFFPDLVLAGRYLHIHSNSDDPASAFASNRLNANSVYFGLTLRWELDFHLKHARLRKAKADALAAREGRISQVAAIRHDVTEAYNKALTADGKVKLAARAHQHARSWVTAVSQSHDMGLAGAREVADSLRAYFQTKMDYAKAVYEMRLARIELAAVTGGNSPGNVN